MFASGREQNATSRTQSKSRDATYGKFKGNAMGFENVFVSGREQNAASRIQIQLQKGNTFNTLNIAKSNLSNSARC